MLLLPAPYRVARAPSCRGLAWFVRGFLIASLGTRSDLAKNWSINIASELEDYLDELEGITFAVEDAEDDKLNFAEGDPFPPPTPPNQQALADLAP